MATFVFENEQDSVNFGQIGVGGPSVAALADRTPLGFTFYGGSSNTSLPNMDVTVRGSNLTYNENSFYKEPTGGTVTEIGFRFMDWVERTVTTPNGPITVRTLEEKLVTVSGLDLPAASGLSGGWTGFLGLFGPTVLADLASGSDLIKAGFGSDSILAGTGNDTVFGNAGNDFIDGGEGADVVDGGIGNDYIVGGGGNDTIFGGADQDQLIGQGGNDSISGDAGDDMLSGEEGDDGLEGGQGADLLFGGNGNDWLTGGAGADTLDGGAGFDAALYTAATAAVVVDRMNGANSRGDAAGDSWISIERFDLSAFNDRFVGNAESEGIFGGAGNDTILAGAGDDWLLGEAGADRLDGGAGWDVASYATATAAVVVDRVTASNSRGDAQGDTFAGIERFLLTDFADRFVGNGEGEMISGGIGNDTLLGGGGNDALWGEAGDDRLTGGTGNDSFSFTAGSGRDVITDFVAGTGVGDTLRFSLGSSFDTYDEIMAVTTQVGVNTMITIDSGSTIVLNNVLKSALVVDDFAFF